LAGDVPYRDPSPKRSSETGATLKKCLFLLVLLLLSACSQQTEAFAIYDSAPDNPPVGKANATPNDPSRPELTVAAAADLQFAFNDIARLFESQTGYKVTLVFGSTGQLAQQIENGAPYDLLAAANIDYVHQLAEKKLVLEDSASLYARGRIVLAANRQAGVSVIDLKDLLNPQIKHIALANPAHAPYGVAAKQALESAGLWETVQPKLVLGENVRQALQYVQTGDAEAGIVALSVADVPEITWVLIDDSLHKPLDQALAIVASSPHQELASQFATFINSEHGRPIMRRYGFILPGETPLLGSNPAP
jgi:molybdate transport system substrate-binding protein